MSVPSGRAPMKKLDRLVAQEVFAPLLVAVLTFVVLVVGHLLFRVISTVVERGVPLWAVAQFVVYQVPNALALALPVSMLLASSLAIHRLARDNELLPLRAAGVSILRLLLPVWAAGVVVSLLGFLVAEFVQPRADRRAEAIVMDMPLSRPALALQPGKFISVREDWYFLPGQVNDQTGEVHDLKAFWVDPSGAVALIQAEKAHVNRRQCVLEHVTFYRLDEAGNPTLGPAARATIDLPQTLATFRGEQKTRRNMTIAELREEARLAASAGSDDARSLRLELHSRISLAFACMAFALLGAPFALAFRDGRSIGGVLAVVFFAFLYCVGMLWARMLGESGFLPPALAAWLPNLVTVAVSGVLVWRRC